jgi:hypothetical protein
MNSLELTWPHGRWQSDAAMEDLAAELEAGRLGEMCPSFADVWNLVLYRPVA